MKKILSIIAIVALIVSVSSCGNKKKTETVGTHTHADGTIHADDAHSHDEPAQESFEVNEDNDTEHEHEHGDNDTEGDKHEHGDETGHYHDHEHGEHK